MKALKHILALLACSMFIPAGHAVQIRREPGHSIPEYLLPTDRDNPALWTPASSYITTRAAAPGAYAIGDIPRLGTIEYPLVLVEFKDLSFTIQDKEDLLKRYDQVFNEHGYTDPNEYVVHGNTFYGATGSVSDYFKDQSYGQYIPKFKIIGPIQLSQGFEYYGKGELGRDENADKMVLEVCDSIITNNLANLSGYARGGTIDQLSIIYAGNGENYDGSNPNTIWPHASILYNYNKNGIRDIKYACTCELFWDSDTILDGIGTFCHEFSHTLGLPDFYNTTSAMESEKNAAMGFWSLMDYGNYENGGFSPVGYTAFEKYSLGWIYIEKVGYAGMYVLNDISQEPNPTEGIHGAYRLYTEDDNQFIILENHRKTGWYKYHKSEGLMVTVVDYNKTSWNNHRPNDKYKRYYILPADTNYHRNTNAGDLFPYQYTDSKGTHIIDSITTRGEPKLKAGSSYPSFSIYNITRDGDLVTFRAGYDLPSGIHAPHEQEISISCQDGELSVSAPYGSRVTIHDISGKKVFETTTTEPVQHISLPGHGIWIVKCGDTVRKVQL